MADRGALGEYLRARRELVDPEDVGLPGGSGRRTPGLRREEVAALAGISADYYHRLEQGRDRNPSPAVVEALARVLQLDDAAEEHLTALAAAASRPARRARTRAETVPAGIAGLVAALPFPAFVENRRFDVLLANPLATALSPAIRVGENRLRSIFLDERERALHPQWRRAAAETLASFRVSIGAGTDDPLTAQLVGELSLASAEFRDLWARHDVRPLSGHPAELTHPRLGPLEIRREKLPVQETDGQILVIFHAVPDSPGGAGLALLGNLVATEASDGQERMPLPEQT